MSILIRGMEMPENCDECVMRYVDHRGYIMCELTHQLVKSGAKDRYDNCPLIEIPPHGRLIDADEFAETLKKVSIRKGYDKLFSDNILSVGDVFDAIATDLKGEGLEKYKLAPTVIEAEGETDGR